MKNCIVNNKKKIKSVSIQNRKQALSYLNFKKKKYYSDSFFALHLFICN